MTPQDQAKQLTDKIVASLSRITEYPDCWLPHSVWVEEVDDTGTPTYRHYMLEKIRPDGTCDLYNPNTGKLEHDDCHLSEINIDWLVVLWNRYIELCIEQGMWKDRAVEILQEQTDADEMTIREFVDEHWQNLLLDEDNIIAFKHYLASKGETAEQKPQLRQGDFVCLTNEALRIVREGFGQVATDYRQKMLLQVHSVFQDETTGEWHVSVQDIHEDDMQEFLYDYLRPATAEDLRSLSDTTLYAFIWSCNFMDRNVSDEEIIEAWKEGASRSKNDESDEEFYEVERLTPDELAERINDECFAYAEDYVRFIEMEE